MSLFAILVSAVAITSLVWAATCYFYTRGLKKAGPAEEGSDRGTNRKQESL